MSKVVHVRNVTEDSESELLKFASQFGIVKASKQTSFSSIIFYDDVIYLL